MPRTSPKCAGRPSPRGWSRTPRSTPCWRVSTHGILHSSPLSCSRHGGGGPPSSQTDSRIDCPQSDHSPKDISMTIHDQTLATDDLAAGERTQTLSDWIRCAGRRIVTWADTCADYYAAAAIYKQLSALSDAELMRRGLSRETLANDVRAACERSSQP